MTDVLNWFSPPVMRLLAWTLLHFLWQGLVLAAIFAGLMASFRNAATRYVLAVSVLVLISRLTSCPFAVKSGGHAAFQGASNIEGGITVSLAALNTIAPSEDGKTVAVGPGKLLDSGERCPVALSIGDEVLFGKYGGTEIEVDGEEVKILRESDILAKLV